MTSNKRNVYTDKDMEGTMLFSLIISVLCGSIMTTRECKDIDTSACVQMFQQRPDLCSDPTIAKTACPAFCKLCPLVCYHCNTTVQDYHLCTKTMTCPDGSVCMRKELKSIYDGHHEYELTCAEKRECDNPWNGSGPLGKRDIMSRDLSVTCCMEDMCNYNAPSTPTPKTSCVKDLILVVDETDRAKRYEHTILSFLNNVVSSLPVNAAEIHVALGLFSNNFRPIFDLNELPSKSETLNALNSQTLKGAHRGDTEYGLSYVLTHALTPTSGDRQDAPNIVLIITSRDAERGAQTLVKENELHIKAEVISVQFGHADFHYLASGTSHDFHISSGNQLLQIVQNVTTLVCYHCNTTVQDYHLCTKTMTCPDGSVCMRKELKSIYDGHHEYELTCAEKRECDNPWNGSGPLGKRDIMSRDLSVTCCMEDMCNYNSPSTPTAKTSCVKDLILVVDETDRAKRYEHTIHSFLNNVVSNLPVNAAEIHVALGLFSNNFRPIFDLNELPSKSETLNALNSQTLKGVHRGDTEYGLSYVLTHALTPTSGDRQDAPNIVLIITSRDAERGAQTLVKENQLHIKAEVISVQFGHADFHYLASGTSHDFHISAGNQFLQIVQNVTSLIC